MPDEAARKRAEARRAEAEAKRAEAEARRAQAEGGDDSNGRVTAEAGRASAEEDRVSAEEDRRTASVSRAAEWRTKGKRLAGAYVGVFVLLFVAVSIQSCGISRNADRLDEQQHELERIVATQGIAQAGSCDRVNLLRANDNRNASIEYQIIRLAVELTQGSPVAAAFSRLSQAVEYVPATDCRSAVGTPRLYRAPEPIPLYALSPADIHRLEKEGVLP